MSENKNTAPNGKEYPADSAMMHGSRDFAFNTGGATLPDRITPRHSVLLSAEEAAQVLKALEGHDTGAFIDDDSLRFRLDRATKGLEAPEPGTEDHFA